MAPVRPLNDPAQYDDLADQWWDTGGAFAMLHWLAAARARLVPRADRAGSILVDIACGALHEVLGVDGVGHQAAPRRRVRA